MSDSTRLGVWVLDGDPGHLNLLNFALPKENYPHTLVMLVASMTSPCTIMDQLEMWSDKLHKHLKSLNIDPDVEKECRQKCKRRFIYPYIIFLVNLQLFTLMFAYKTPLVKFFSFNLKFLQKLFKRNFD